MNTWMQTPHTWNEKKWYFLSLFYAREKWAELISEIMYFYRERENQFCTCLISFSGEKGEHIEVTFASPGNDNNNYSNEIQTHFQTFLDQYPSISRMQFPYGKAVWCNYPNNSLIWNIFKLKNYSDPYIRFHQQTTDVALKLTDGDFSEDSVFSLGMYLITKGLCCIAGKGQKDALSQALHEASVGSPHFVYAAKELINEMDICEISEALELYLNENETEYSLEMISWLNEVKILLTFYNYETFCSFICEIIGLKGLRQLMILELMNNWYNTKQNANA